MKTETIETILSAFIAAALVSLCLLMSTGCAPLIGIKSYETAESRTEFITGWDFGLSANGVDTVDNSRGIKPNESPKFRQARNG